MTKKKFNAQQRLVLYEYAYNKYLKDVSNQWYYGLCHALYDSMIVNLNLDNKPDVAKENSPYNETNMKYFFPEIYASKPKNTFDHEGWFPWKDTKSRINIFVNAINNVKNIILIEENM